MPASEITAHGFARASEADWHTLAARGRVGHVATLAAHTMDGLPIGPVHAPGHGPVLAMRPAGAPWIVFQRLDSGPPENVRKAIATALAGGATGIELVYDTSPATYGRGIAAQAQPSEPGPDSGVVVRVDAGPETPRLVAALRGLKAHAAYDPLSTLAASGSDGDLDDSYAAIARLIAEGVAATAFAADGRVWHNGGATEVQELGIALASSVESFRRLAAHGCAPEESAARLGVILAADADQFLTMAKFRAMRLLLARIGEVAGFAVPAPVHAETSWRMLGAREPTMNLVRATTATFAAATGGADSITVLPPLLDDPAFADRMARNVQTILLEESALYRTADPGAGSGAIEDLTNRLAVAAWDLFTGIEREGGLLAAIRSGTITRTVAEARDARLEAVARRRMPMVGVNVNVDPAAPKPPYRAEDGGTTAPLVATRLAGPIESLASRVDGARIGLLSAGAPTEAGFGDALAALGFAVVPLRSAGEAAAKPPRIACFLVGDGVGPDAAAMADALRAAGVGYIVAVGGRADQQAGGFDAVAAADADLVALFSGVLDQIADRQENGQV